MRIVGGLLVAAIGVAIIISAAALSKALGRWEWAENHLGGTMQGYVIIGFVIIIMGVMMMFGSQFVQPDPSALKIN